MLQAHLARTEKVNPAINAVVRRQREAGAILLGKTNLPPFLSSLETDNEVFGREVIRELFEPRDLSENDLAALAETWLQRARERADQSTMSGFEYYCHEFWLDLMMVGCLWACRLLVGSARIGWPSRLPVCWRRDNGTTHL